VPQCTTYRATGPGTVALLYPGTVPGTVQKRQPSGEILPWTLKGGPYHGFLSYILWSFQ
jgi:hypothetical protein